MRDTITSPRVLVMKRKKRASSIRLAVLVFMLVVSIIGALAYFSSHPRVTLQTIVVSGTHIVNPLEIESLIRNEISGKYIHSFAKANSFIYPKKDITENILAAFPRIETLSLSRGNINTLNVVLTERTGSYLYCGNTVPEELTEVGENCYFINNDGYIFDKAPYFSGNIYFKYYLPLPNSNTESPLGANVLSKESFQQLARFIDGITLLGFSPVYLTIEDDGIASLYLNKKSGTLSPKILFRNDDTTNEMLDNLSAAMAKEEFANEIKNKYTTLLYIDLRFNNKVVYKFQ